MKKKIVSIILSVCLCCSVTACGNSGNKEQSSNNTSKEITEQTSEENGSEEELSVDKNLLSVEVTLPASLIGDSESTELTEEAKSRGVKDITENSDGSITMKMTKKAHKELLDSIKTSIDESINEMLADKESCPSFDSITYNDDVTVFDVKVDPAIYGGMEIFSAFAFYVYGNMYQALNAVPESDLKTVVNFINKDTGEVIESGDSTALTESVTE